MIDGKTETIRLAGGGVVITVWGITLNEWAAILAIVYTLINILILVPKLIDLLKRAWRSLYGKIS